jgi:hypothetical protein
MTRKARAWALVKLKPKTSFALAPVTAAAAAMPSTRPPPSPIQGSIATEKTNENLPIEPDKK